MKKWLGPLFFYLVPLLAVVITVAMVFYPEIAFEGAVEGLRLWWDIVFPALLPFFIGSELLMGLGVVHFMGRLLEPLMAPVFRVPGVGSFVLAMGLASGYPIGAVLTGKLRREDLINKVEAERLVSFTNTADPLFMSGAVAVGMFKNAALAPVIMAAHYLASISTGLLLRCYRPRAPRTPTVPGRGSLLRRALEALREARAKDGRPFGQLLGDSVKSSVNTLLLVGGFIILFSVLVNIIKAAGILATLSTGAGTLLAAFGLDPNGAPALVAGLFEITNGTQLASIAPIPLSQQLMLAGTIIAWSGLSVHAQVAAVTHGTDISIAPYVMARLVHAGLAAFFTYLILGPAATLASLVVPTLAGSAPTAEPYWLGSFIWSTLSLFRATAGLSFLALVSLLLAGKGPRSVIFRHRR